MYSGGNTGTAFSIDTNGNLITTANTIDYETVQSFSLIVQATDGPGLTGKLFNASLGFQMLVLGNSMYSKIHSDRAPKSSAKIPLY